MIAHKEFSNGFKYLEINNNFSHAKIALQGAHIFEFTPHDAKPILWLSETSNFKYGESIRGGIPICWPWFGMHKKDKALPQHGFARIAIWEFISSKELENATQITMMLKSDAKTKEMFPYEFELTLVVEVGKELNIQLTTKNLDSKPFSISQALHSYFNISDTKNISILGLKDKPYLDALDMKQKVQTDELKIDKEVDRVFQEVDGEIKLKDKHNTLSIINEGSSSVVVWNPWIEKCSRMSAMKKNSYKTFVCIESANAFDDAKEIKAGLSHTLKCTISLLN